MKKENHIKQIFLKFAVPCAFIIHQRGKIDDEMLADLELAAMGKKKIPRKILEKIFWKAFERIDLVAKEMNLKRWDESVIREYFLHRHNDFIENGYDSYKNAPASLKELCKVQEGTVVELQKKFGIAKLPNGKIRTFIPIFIPDIKIGDKILLHYGYVVERVASEN